MWLGPEALLPLESCDPDLPVMGKDAYIWSFGQSLGTMASVVENEKSSKSDSWHGSGPEDQQNI